MHRFFLWKSLVSLLFFVVFLITGCASKVLTPGQVHDLRVLPQEPGYFISADLDGQLLIPAERQQRLAEEFLGRHFAPWNPGFSDLTDDSDPFWGLKRYQGREAYGENLLPLPATWLETMERQSVPDLYPSLVQPAVTVVSTSLRVLPTHRPVFSNPSNPGEGFPFDYLQNSLAPAGTPVLVVHASLNGDWYLVKTPHVSGWVRPWEVAWVDQDFMDAFRSSDMIAVLSDNAVVRTEQGMFALPGRAGMLLPRSPEPSPPGAVGVLAPQRGADGWAELKSALVQESVAAPWPLAPTSRNYLQVLDGLMGQAYGWGGMFENRDCSALIQDVQALFGIAMPRNSRAQARAGRVVDLEGLSGAEKERLILEQGVPLLSIVNMPGHVMLYLGPDPATGRPVVLHSMWGVRTKPPGFLDRHTHLPGRWVLGRTVITTLTPGAELSNLIKPTGLLVERVSSLTVLGE
ncbi:Cell wall-associated hydrolase, NlpC family [Desulfonatronum thiosulfatophilum]|uniref:Cell wall-associated hydrolase, NlpC family n=1 Tax=Desulfonatronum thiosulfatophilum TaxID=617002 RepID=A0A1G6A3N6_9BACT|nr:SH3 domain-containing protein [Desulfonatronum thiosulfatophilum]SDB03044.1 Cell wall-associated hydrolase, NlpC family [Desulfonatronum thiosulfatophilum]